MFALAFALVVAAAPIEGQGSAITELKKVVGNDLKNLRALDARGPFRIRVVGGDPAFIEVTTEQNLVSHISAKQEGDTLVLKSDVDVVSARGINVVVHMPTLERVTVSGQVNLTGDIKADAATITASGASHLTLTGKAASARFDIKGAGHVDAAEFVVDNATVVVSGAADIAVNARATLDVSGRGVARVKVRGSPKLTNTAAATVRIDEVR